MRAETLGRDRAETLRAMSEGEASPASSTNVEQRLVDADLANNLYVIGFARLTHPKPFRRYQITEGGRRILAKWDALPVEKREGAQ